MLSRSYAQFVAVLGLVLVLGGCGGLQEVWEGPGARVFRPQSIAVLPPMSSQYDSAREDIQEVLAVALNRQGRIERVVTPENVTDIFQTSKEAFDSLVFYFSRLEMTGQSDKDSAIKLGRSLNVDSFWSSGSIPGNTCVRKAIMSGALD